MRNVGDTVTAKIPLSYIPCGREPVVQINVGDPLTVVDRTFVDGGVVYEVEAKGIRFQLPRVRITPLEQLAVLTDEDEEIQDKQLDGR